MHHSSTRNIFSQWDISKQILTLLKHSIVQTMCRCTHRFCVLVLQARRLSLAHRSFNFILFYFLNFVSLNQQLNFSRKMLTMKMGLPMKTLHMCIKMFPSTIVLMKRSLWFVYFAINQKSIVNWSWRSFFSFTSISQSQTKSFDSTPKRIQHQ